jgi:hypothetical protein
VLCPRRDVRNAQALRGNELPMHPFPGDFGIDEVRLQRLLAHCQASRRRGYVGLSFALLG